MRALSPFALLLVLVSCKKSGDNIAPTTSPYRISGLHDVEIQTFQFPKAVSSAYPIPIFDEDLIIAYQTEGGPLNPLTLQIEDLPAGMTGKFTVNSGVPDFATHLTIGTIAHSVGNYKAQVVVQSDGDSQKYRFPISINVTSAPACSDYLLAKKYQFKPSRSNKVVPLTLSLVNSESNLYTITGFVSSGEPLNATITCDPGTLEIPEQQIGDTTFFLSALMAGSGFGLGGYRVYFFKVASNGSRIVKEGFIEAYD
jgi:hypothetical protein